MSQSTIILPSSELELAADPIDEVIYVVPKAKAVDIYHNHIEYLERSFVTFLHIEHIHHIFQRCTTADSILLTPNICAELFTFAQCFVERNYIGKRLIGAIFPGSGKIEAMDSLWRQTHRKLVTLDKACNAPHKLFFFYDREVNMIYKTTEELGWRFYESSPIYERLKKLYKTLSKL